MKNKLKTALCFLFAFICLVMTSACSRATLSAPTELDIDEDVTLTWNAVPNARVYYVQIVDVDSGESVEYSARRANYSLYDLSEGDYEICVRAEGGDSSQYSEWSEVFVFHRDYESGLRYSLINNNTAYEVTRVGTASGALVIEDYYRGKPVTQIAAAAFRSGSNVESVVVGENVVSIGDNAFYNCSRLASVTLPDSLVSIGISSFQNCYALERVNLPQALTEIPDYAFAYCRSLANIEIGDNVESIGAAAFTGCSALTGITIPDSVTEIGEHAFDSNTESKSVSIGSGVTSIGAYAFYRNTSLRKVSFAEPSGDLTLGTSAFGECDSLAAVELPEGLTSIGAQCFYASDALSSVKIPSSVTSVGVGAFNATALYVAQIDNGFVYADDWLVSVSDAIINQKDKWNITSATFKSGIVGIADQAFYSTLTKQGAAQLSQVEFPTSLKHLGDYAFYNTPNLSAVYSPVGGLVSVGKYAFAYCRKLRIVSLGEGLETIGNFAFYYCDTLYNPTLGGSLIPDSVTRVGTYAFNETGLWSVPGADGVIYAGKWAVGVVSGAQGTIELASDTRGIADYAFYQCENIEGVNNLYNVQYIGEGAFYKCSRLALISLNRNLRTIEPYTFYECYSLFNVNFPTSLTAIGARAFYNCELLNALDLGGTYVTEIGERAFYGCKNLKTIEFSDTLETIAFRAFYQCQSVGEFVIPDSVTAIADEAFAKCSNLKQIDFGKGLISIGNNAFRECFSLSSVLLPDSVEYVGDFAFYNCTSVGNLVLGAGLKSIGSYAFANLPNLYQATLPAGIVSVGDYAFANCSLQAIVLRGSPQSVGANAFYNCKRLTIYAEKDVAIGAGWNESWNSSFRPVVWNCTLSDDGAFVRSVTVGEIANGYAWLGFSAPARNGYTFLGWAKTPDATVAEYGVGDLMKIEKGTVLYSVWSKDEDEPVADDPDV